MGTVTVTANDLTTLAKFDSPTVANVLELFNFRSYIAGYTNSTIRAVYPTLPPIVGFAATMTYRSSQPAGQGDVYSKMSQFLDTAADVGPPPIAVIQDLDDPHIAASYGEVMVASMKAFGFVGLITSGAGRDYDQVRELKFPCWASSMIVSHGYGHLIECNLPVVVGGLALEPKELLHADGNGVVQIPLSIASAVAELCEPFVAAEQIVLDYTQDPHLSIQGYHEAMDKKNQLVADLTKQAEKMMPSN